MDLQGALARVRRVYLVDLVWRTIEHYGRDDGAVYATAVAYRVLFSLFPLLIVFVAVFGLLTALPGIGPWLTRLTADQAPGDNLRQLVESISGVSVVYNGVAGLTGLVFLVLGAGGMFDTLRLALNRAFGVSVGTDYVRARALDLAGVAVMFLVGLLGIVLATGLGALRGLVGRYLADRPAALVSTVVDWLVTYTLTVLVALLLYRLVPSHKLQVRELLPAALLAAVGFQLTRVGFGIYLTNFASYQKVYGALAGAVALLVFLYIDATITLYAARFAAELARDRRARSAE